MNRLRRFASGAFRLALALLPREFRRRFGREVVSAFEARANTAEAGRGTRGVVGVLAASLIDVLERAPVEHWEAAGKVFHNRRRGSMSIAGWVREVRASARGLRRRPGFSAAIVGTLALGIGANAAIFTVVDGVLLEPLSFPEADRIVILAAVAFTRLMDAILFEISPTDPPLTLARVPVVLLPVSALACWIPARRAATVDPVKALMAE